MTDDALTPAAIAAGDQLAAEIAERVGTATIYAASIGNFYRVLKEEGVPATLAAGLTHRFADWFFGALPLDEDE